MSFLKIFIDSPLAGAIGWTLLHSLWEGAIVSSVLAAILAAERSARIRYAAACLAMLVMLVGFGATLVYLIPQRSHLASQQGVGGAQARTIHAAQAILSESPSLAAIVPWLAPFWITGVSLIYLRRVADSLSIRRLRTRGVCSAPERWQSEVARLGAQLRISRPVVLLESCLTDVPVVLGHLRPLILMPIGLLAALPLEQIEAILLHELAHIRRHDYLMNMLQRLVEGLFFYHPGVWWISRIMRCERENLCDDVVVSISGNAHGYASALAALEEHRQSIVQPAVAATGGSVVKRIRRLLYPARTKGPWAPYLAAVIFILTTVVSLAALQSEPWESASATTPTKAESTTGSAYSNWLNQDVVYIINDAERAAFLGLTSNEEKNKFIEQFWARRDPSPGTPRNEFKEEHYRRVAYANMHFGTQSGTPGWETDRGHIYIVYGAPDEIEAHPSGTAQIANASEVWTYKHVNGSGNTGSFTFIDQTGRGDYRLAPGGDVK